jgi:hypothetical protein
MAGTKAGGKAAAETNKRIYGDGFFRNIGRKGGRKGARDGTIKGFAAMTPEKRREAGRRGGEISKRTKKLIS